MSVRLTLIIAGSLLASTFAAAQLRPSVPTQPAAPLNRISDVSLSPSLVNALKAKIAASPDAKTQAGQTTSSFDLNELYNILVRFAANRETYTDAISHYATIFQLHSGVAGILYRDQAYSQLVQSADNLLVSLKALQDYLRYSGVAVSTDTSQITATLMQFSDAKGAELHSVIDSLQLTGLTLEQLQALSARATENGNTLQQQILVLRQMLIEKGASLHVAGMPQ